MKKIALFTLLPITLILLLAARGYSQEEMRVVDNSVFARPQRAPAMFAHDAHNAKAGIDDCAQCHHLYDDKGRKVEDESSEDQRCADCHALEAQGRIPALRQAFHRNCKGCHVALGQGPVVCAQCHVTSRVEGDAP
ncbi:MAG: cytochrome c3 family protein [Desulfatitalea sp.]